MKNLVSFEKVSLAIGESTKVTFVISASDLGYWVNGKRRVDPDVYTFFVGSSSDNANLTQLEVTVN